MRVTNSMMVGTLLRDLNVNMGKMIKSQEQLSSGHRINRPSDDPVGLVDSLRLRTNLTELEQFKTNAEEGQAWLETSDLAMNEFGSILHRVRELTVQAGNGSLSQNARDAIAEEVDQLRKQLVTVGNTKYGDRYVFSGTKTTTPAFDNLGVFQGNADSIQFEVGPGVQVPVNVNGAAAFTNVFTVMDNLVGDLNSGNFVNITGARLSDIDSVMDNHLTVRADLGARVNRIELAINRMDGQNTNMTDLLSKAEDVDMAELITRIKVEENVYQASLSAGARIVQPTLMDFLR